MHVVAKSSAYAQDEEWKHSGMAGFLVRDRVTQPPKIKGQKPRLPDILDEPPSHVEGLTDRPSMLDRSEIIREDLRQMWSTLG